MAGAPQIRTHALALLAVCLGPLLSSACPDQCSCDAELVSAQCADPDLDRVPAGLPSSLQVLRADLPRMRELSADTLSALDAPGLLRLVLVNSGLQTVNRSAFTRLPKLESLNLTSNRLRQLDPAAFPDSLRFLALSDNALQVPSSGPLLRAANVTSLSMERCGLTELPPQLFSELPQLESLWLEGNELTELGPNALAAAPHLSWLGLKQNAGPLRLHPDALAANRDLAWLNLDSTRLQVPAPGDGGEDGGEDGRLLNSASLESLSLGDNGLSRLPSGLLRGLPQLLDLYINRNDLTSLPDDLFRPAPKLREVRLEGNRLTQLPAALLAPLTSLRWLSLNNNSLGPVPGPGPLLQHPTLYGLSLADNGLTELPAAALAGVPQLKALVLLDNPQLRLDTEELGAALPQLEEIRLSDHPLVCPCIREVLRTGWPGNRTVYVYGRCGPDDSRLC